MKKILTLCVFASLGLAALAQDLSDAQQAAADAAASIDKVNSEATTPAPKPNYWTNSLATTINFGQTSLTNWAAGGYNSYTLKAYIDGNANYAKGLHSWKNRLQLDYGFLYSADKPVLQKSDDRIYLESKYGYEIVDKFNATAEFSFKSQFSNTWTYNTPTAKADGSELADGEDYSAKDWKNAATIKSGLLAPAYTNLALGIEYVPAKWITINLAPLTGGIVTVMDESLRSSYSMDEKAWDADGNVTEYKANRFEFGAQLKVDAKVNVNDNFKYTTQVVLFSNYLQDPQNLRVNWDNRFDFAIHKYFSLVLSTNLIYDPLVTIDGKTSKIQFKESLAFGFAYTIASKK